jgi:hypothetical protein
MIFDMVILRGVVFRQATRCEQVPQEKSGYARGGQFI